MPGWVGAGVAMPLPGCVGDPPRDQADAHVAVDDQAAALAPAHARVPQDEVVGRDGAVVVGDDVAGVARLDLGEPVAVADHHARVRGRGRGDAVGGQRRGGRGSVPNDTDAGVLGKGVSLGHVLWWDYQIMILRSTYRQGPEARAIAFGCRVPQSELGRRDGIQGRDGCAVLILLDVMELVAIFNNTGLDRDWRCDAIAGKGGGGGWRNSRAGDLGSGLG